jgi:hypothetical protein
VRHTHLDLLLVLDELLFDPRCLGLELLRHLLDLRADQPLGTLDASHLGALTSCVISAECGCSNRTCP